MRGGQRKGDAAGRAREKPRTTAVVHFGHVGNGINLFFDISRMCALFLTADTVSLEKAPDGQTWEETLRAASV